MTRILIVTAGPLCRNPRVLKEATALGRAGFQVTVLTLANIGRFEDYDTELMRGAPFEKVALDRISRRPIGRLVNFVERALSWLARHAVRLGIESPVALGPYHALRRCALRMPADLTIVHTELPFCIGASLLARGRLVAADFEDWHSRDLLPSSQAGRPLRLIERTERLLMRQSAYTSAPSGAMAEALAKTFGGSLPIVIPNAFALQSAPRALPRMSPPAFFWFSQTIGPGRGLEAFLAAWVLMRMPSQLCILGDISGEYREALVRPLPGAHRGSIRFYPITSPDELPARIAMHDVGLALEPATPESRSRTATNKIFQYLNAGLALVATPTAGQRELLSQAPGAGILIDLKDAAAAAAALDALLADPPPSPQWGPPRGALPSRPYHGSTSFPAWSRR